jgi:PAS domain-containing protein
VSTTIELIDEIDRQFALLRNRGEAALYDDGSFLQVKRFQVASEAAMHLENASGFAFQMLDALPMSVFVKDAAERRYVYLNAKARSMMNFASKAVIGRVDRDVLSDQENYLLYKAEDDAVLQSKSPRSVNENWIDETGRFTVHRTTRYPVMRLDDPDGAPIGVVSIAEDLSYEQKVDAANELMTLITHDLVTGILRVIDFHGTTDDTLRGYIPAYDFLLDYLDALAWYLPTENGAKAFGKSIDVVQFSAAVIEPLKRIFPALLRPKLTDDPIEWHYDLNMPADVICNPKMLRIMVYQQMRNHLRHGDQWHNGAMPPSGVRNGRTSLSVSVSPITEVRDGSQPGYALTFASNGEPIPAEFRPQLGVRGFRVPKRDRYGFRMDATGIGFGLYFCKRIAELHKGEFVYSYDEVVGANRFTYNLPYRPKFD